MTIRVYSVADELTGSDALYRKCARFELIVAARYNALSRPMMRKVKFSVTGTTDAAVEAAGVQIAEEILALTQAKVLKFSKILGHYRQDEIVPVIAQNQKSVGVVGFSPDPDTLEAVNLTLVIPWFDGTIANAAALVGERTVGGGTAGLGYIRWQDQEEESLEAMNADFYRGVSITSMERVYNEPEASDNSADGLGDDHLGPKV